MSYYELLVRKLPKRLRAPAQSAKLRLLGGESLVPEQELEEAYRRALLLLKQRHDRIGDYLEFGVYTGASLVCMHRAALGVGEEELRLFGFDSFEGLPDEAAEDDGGTVWWPRQFAASRKLAERRLRRNGVPPSRAVLVPGWFDETLTAATRKRLGIEKAGVIMVDCDMYLSAKTALDFCAPLIRDDAVLLFDDWDSADLAADDLGEKKAFEEFLAENPGLVAEELESYSPAARVFLVSRPATS